MEPTFHIAPFSSEAYKQTVDLRYRILREPLGLQFTPEQLSAEAHDLHIYGCIDNKMVACLVLTPISNNEIKMRQVAVAERWQGQGIGSQLLRYSENMAWLKGYTLITLHARQTAVAFYLRLGYNIIGEAFMEVWVEHWRMWKGGRNA